MDVTVSMLLHSDYSTALGISIGLTAIALIQERKEGLIDRTWVAGVNVTEIIISQVITQFFILVVQILLMLVFVLWVFKVCMYVIFEGCIFREFFVK